MARGWLWCDSEIVEASFAKAFSKVDVNDFEPIFREQLKSYEGWVSKQEKADQAKLTSILKRKLARCIERWASEGLSRLSATVAHAYIRCASVAEIRAMFSKN